MSDPSEPEQVCRRNALAFLGYAGMFGLVASSSIFAVSEAMAQTTAPAAAPATPPADVPNQAQNAVRKGVAGEPSGGRSAAPDARSGGKSDAQDATSDGTLATAPRPLQRPPSKKNSPFIRASTEAGPPHRRPGEPVQKLASAGLQTHGPVCQPLPQLCVVAMRRQGRHLYTRRAL